MFEGQVYKALGLGLQWVGPLPKFSRLVGGLDFGGANPDAHKTAGVVAGIVAPRQPAVSQNALVRFAHFEDASATVHANLLSWMRTVEVRMGRRVAWRADKTQMWGISQAQDAGFLIEPSPYWSDMLVEEICISSPIK